MDGRPASAVDLSNCFVENRGARHRLQRRYVAAMKRRQFIQRSLAVGFGTPLLAALRQERLDEATDVLKRATAEGQISTAVLHVVQREASFTRAFGKASSEHSMFLLGSISKPICVTALMTLF